MRPYGHVWISLQRDAESCHQDVRAGPRSKGMLEGAVRLVADNTHTSHFVAALKRKPHARVWGYVYGGLAVFDSTLSAYNYTGEARLTNSGLPRRAIVRVKKLYH